MKTTAVCVLSTLALAATAALRAADAAAAKEEKLTLEQCPAKVQAAVTKAGGDGVVQGVRKVSAGGAVTYVADIAITFDSEGNVLKGGLPVTTGPQVPAGSGAAGKIVTVDFAGTTLQEVCAALTKQAGVNVTCGGAFAAKPVTLALKEATLADAVKAIATQTGTRAESRDGGYRFRTGSAR
jgi:hypothetical protein